MAETWTLIDSSSQSARCNMARDEQLLLELTNPTLHLYAWERPSVTYGYFIDPREHLDLDALQARGIDSARRPTGGGIVFHTHDLAFSVLIPAYHEACSLNTLERYAWVNSRVLEAVEAFLHRQKEAVLCKMEPDEPAPCQAFCMAKPTRYDVMMEGKKVGGAAQRKVRTGFLHQGTICLQVPPREMLEAVLLGEGVKEAMMRHSFTLGGGRDLEEVRAEMKERLKGVFV